MGQVNLELALLYNMIISAALSLIVGFAAGYLGHWLATARDRENRKWNELRYWQDRVFQVEGELRKTERPGGALQLTRMDTDEDPSWPGGGGEKDLIIEGRKAYKNVRRLEKELFRDRTAQR